MKAKDRTIRAETNIKDISDDAIPPVRSATGAVDVIDKLMSINSKPKRITSSDYDQWDKYDAGTAGMSHLILYSL